MNELSRLLNELSRLLNNPNFAGYSESGNRVIQGDCVKVMRTLAAESVDCVITDPPYLVNYKPRDGRIYAGDNESSWVLPAYKEIARVLKPDSYCVTFYGWPKGDIFYSAWRAAGLRPVGHLIFPKRYATQSKHVEYRHEQAMVLAKGNPRPCRTLSDVIPFEYSGNSLHPTQKPLCALVPLVETFSKKGDLVLDPFCGSGTTLEAAQKLGRRFIGIEVVEQYAKAAKQRTRYHA